MYERLEKKKKLGTFASRDMKLTLQCRDVTRGWRKTPTRGEAGGEGTIAPRCGKGGTAGGIGNSNTSAIKLNNEESGRSKYEHGYDLRPRKPVHNE